MFIYIEGDYDSRFLMRRIFFGKKNFTKTAKQSGMFFMGHIIGVTRIEIRVHQYQSNFGFNEC